MTDAAKKQRAAEMIRLNKIIEGVGGNLFNNFDFYQIRIRIDRAKEVFASFENANMIVTGATEEEAERTRLWQEFSDLEENFLDASSTMTRRFVELTPATVVQPSPADAPPAANQAPQVIKVQMPLQFQNMRNTWGFFDGSLQQWLGFKDRFDMSVNSQPDIPAIYKFSFLKESLTGEAAELLGGWGLQEDNYEDAWNRLLQKYGQKFPLACAHLNTFFNLPNLGRTTRSITAKDLQHMSNVACETRRLLRSMDYPVAYWDLMFVHALQTRLDGIYRVKWDTERGNGDYPTMEKMTRFLDKESERLKNSEVSYQPLHVTIQNERSNQPSARSNASNTMQLEHPCPVCKQVGHKVFDCPEFKPLSVYERSRVVKTNNMYPNCLRRGHTKDSCWDTNRCKFSQCQGDNMHNSMLCPYKGNTQRVMTMREESPRLTVSGRGRGKPVSKRPQGRYESS